MIYIIIGLIVFVSFCFPVIPFIFSHLFSIIYYSVKDIISFFKNKKWRIYENYGIYIYGGLYGGGKSLSITKYCEEIYKKYNNVKFISNIDLHNVPYEKFEYFEQLMDSPDYDGQCIIYVIDEIGSLMNARNYKNNRIGETQFLYTLNQIRKQNKTLLLASQRFGMCDKNFRQCAVQWIECSKFWRICSQLVYDPYDLECSLNPKLVKPIKRKSFFLATDKLFNAYDTKQLVKDFKDNFDKNNFNPIVVEPNDTSLAGDLSMARRLSHKGKRRKGF